MDRLIERFNTVDALSPEAKQLIREHVYYTTLKKGEYFYREGDISNRIGFVLEGVLRVARIEEDGTEITRYFINEGHFAVDLESYNNLVPSIEFQEALSDCKFVIITRDAMNLFNERIPNFRKIISLITEKALLEKYAVKSEMLTDDAPTRYAKLMKRNPNIVQRVPLQFISSFLGVTPFTLSRIRKQFR
jgi:CRP/FNR family transcriptional regulator, anaerobic regulatory protein